MSKIRKLFSGLGAVALAAATTAALPATPAQAATGPYGGRAFVDLVHAEALTVPDTFNLADVSVSPALAEVNSGGIEGAEGARSHARATNLDAVLLDGNLPLEGLLVQAEQSAPPNNAAPAVDGPLVEVPADPLLNARAATALAHARWAPEGQCIAPGTPISESRVEVADASVLTDVDPGIGDALVSLHNDQGSTVFTDSYVQLVEVDGQTTRGVESRSLTQLTSVTLFEGTENELTVNVVAPPEVTAVATGQPGGAEVTYTEPVLQVLQNGELLGELNASEANQTIDLSPLAVIKIGTLESEVAEDGTSASGEATLFSVRLGNDAPIDPLLELSIAAGSVAASVPAGGVECPGGEVGGPGDGGDGDDDNPLRETHKDLSAADVQPGGTFEYNVVVPNRGECTLVDVTVVDTITGPVASIETDPAGEVDGNTITWTIDELAPNETQVFDITVTVPSDASPGTTYSNEVTASGTCEDDGEEHDHSDTIDGPTVVEPGDGGCNLSDSNISESHTEVFVDETFTYFIHLFNSGGEACNSITVTQDLHPESSFVSCSDSCVPPAEESNGTVTWEVPALGAGSSKTLTAVARVASDAPEGTQLESSFDATPASGEPGSGSTDGPVVTGTSVLAPPNPARRTDVLGGTEDNGPRAAAPGGGGLAATGGPALPAVALGLLGGGIYLLRRRRLTS